METTYRLTIHVALELANKPPPADEWDDEPDRVDIEAKAIEALNDDPDLQTVLFQLRSLHETELVIQDLRDELEQELSTFTLGEERLEAVLRGVAVDNHKVQLLVEATRTGFLEEIES